MDYIKHYDCDKEDGVRSSGSRKMDALATTSEEKNAQENGLFGLIGCLEAAVVGHLNHPLQISQTIGSTLDFPRSGGRLRDL